MYNRLLFTLIFGALPYFLSAQHSEGGLPPSAQRQFREFLTVGFPIVSLPVLDVEAALKDDSRTPGQNRFAAPIDADIALGREGTWTELPDGSRVWRCGIKSTGALGLVLMFDRFVLPPGAKFYAYDAQGVNRFGAYTDMSQAPTGKFLIGIIPGDTAVLEYFEPFGVRGQGAAHIFRVDYVYDKQAARSVEPAGVLGYGDGLSCHVNVNCSAGQSWQTQKKGVGRIMMVFSNGTGWCSGSLIANTSNTGEPYFLTAHHCQLIGNNPDFSLWRFDFDYEAPGCSAPTSQPQPKSVLGCQRISYRAETDFMLLKLNPIPNDYGLYFNGWERTSPTTITRTTFIHHPVGDIKKISVDTNAATIHNQTIDWGGQFGVSPLNTHWKVDPDIGIYQPGSSGCPLFNPSKLIVGQLHGGIADNCNITASYFGMFNISWAAGSSAQSRLYDWLDPNQTQNTQQAGYAQPIINLYNITGHIQTYWGAPVAGVKVQLSGNTTHYAVTDTLGNYTFSNITGGTSYTITPSLDTNDLNGVSTIDFLKINRHILTIENFNSPWAYFAADANKSGSVTSNDITICRKLLFGIDPSFTANTSWRFFTADVNFANPVVLYPVPIPEESLQITLNAHFSGANFIAVKIGDVNESAVPKP